MKNNVVDMLEELQALDARQLETAQIKTRPVRFAKGDKIALRQLETLFGVLFLSYSSGGPSSQQCRMASLSAPCILTGLSRQRYIM